MRVILLALLIPLAHAQFELFSRPSYEDSYNTISDVVGMNDAIGVWGKMIRNLANRNHGSDALRQFTVRPQHVDVDQLKTLPKGKGEIINEKLLNMLLPRIKGQPAFTTTTKATTTTTSTTTTTTQAPSTTATEAPSTTTEAPTTKSSSPETTTAAETTTSTVEETTTTQQETTTEEATTTTTEQPVDNLPVIAKSESNGGPQFTVVFHTADKSILDKKSNVEVVDFNQDKEEVKEVISTTKPTEKPKEKEEPTTKGTTVKKETASTTEASTTTMSAAEIDLRRALKEKFEDDEEEVPKRVTDEKKTTVESTTMEVTTAAAETITKKSTPKVKPAEKKEKKDDQKDEKKEEKKKEEKKEQLKKEEKPAMKPDEKKKEEKKEEKQKPNESKPEEKKEKKEDTTEKKNVVKEETKHENEKKEAKVHEKKEEAKSDEKKKESVKSEKKKDDGKKEELTKKDKVETKTVDEKKKEKPEDSKKEKVAAVVKKETTNKTTEKKDKESSKTGEKTSTEVEAQIEKEASEILELLNKPTNNTIQELRRKNLFDKLREYLKQQEKDGKGEPQKSTTKKVVSTTVAPTTSEAPKTTSVKEEPVTETSTTPKLEKSEETTASSSSTTITVEKTATQEIITSEGVGTTEMMESVKKTGRIPEAEEDEPAFVQEDVPADDTTTEAVPTTTLVHATPASAGTTGTVYNINANANSEANPQIANVITPIAGIMDSISPILAPLLGGGAASRTRARGSKTYEFSYEPSGGRDIMADSPGETSLVGFGTQLAREILSPGVLKRERMDRERMMAAKIDEARKMRESKSLLATVLDMAKTGPPLALPMITTPQPSVFAPNPHFSQQQGNFALHAANPPPGYNGPRAPLPPPPPPGYVPRGYTGTIPSNFGFPTTLSQQQDQSPITVDGSSAQTKNTPYYPPNLDTTTSAVNVKDEGFLQGRSGVRTTFMADSGVPMQHNPSASGQVQVAMPNLPAFGIAPASESGAAGGSGGGSGFGGGRQPSVSFDDSSRGLKQDNSFFTSRRLRV